MQEVISATRKTATRKLKYRCMECNQPILKGQGYERLVQKWDGEIQSDCSHSICTDFAHEIHAKTPRYAISLLEPHDGYGRSWMWEAVMDCWYTRKDILKEARTNRFVRQNLLLSLLEVRNRYKTPTQENEV